MTKYLISRTLQAIIVLFGVTLVTFILVNVVPGDPVLLMLDKRADPQTIARIRTELGFDKPYYEQYLSFLGQAIRGDFGQSYFEKTPVTDMIVRSLRHTVKVASLAFVLALVVGLAAGIASAAKHNSVLDRLIMFLSTLSISAPSFWIAVLLQILFGVKWRLLPLSGVDKPGSLILPVITLGIAHSASIARITRVSVLEAINQDYVRTARAKGVDNLTVLLKHVLKNALIPIITIVGLVVRGLLGGSILVETVFGIPGFGSLMVSSILTRDLPLLQGCVVYCAAIFVVINLLVDLSYGVVNPRVRLVEER
jgi:peptide/nickel transport system permease protein